jgi:hypothetical protein
MATPNTAGSACSAPRTSATLKSTSPATATPTSHSHSTPRGMGMRLPVSREMPSSSPTASA